MPIIDRRVAERFAVQPAYTPCRIRGSSENEFTQIGHVHNVSESGVRFESDMPIDPGTQIAIEIDLPDRPDASWRTEGPGRAVFVIGEIVWCDVDEPGPAVMAVATTRYCREGDRARLMRRLTTGGFSRAS